MNLPKVSIIIPVFNSAKFIRQCIQSVITQTLKEIEIIIINDGSTDASKEIIGHFAKSDTRILHINTLNLGVSAARNTGLNIAKGEYIGFVDADDWLEPQMFENLLNQVLVEKADMAICNVWTCRNDENPEPRLTLVSGIFDIAADKVKTIAAQMDFKYDYANWNKIYKRATIAKNHILFNEKMSVWEDLLFNLYFLYYAKKICILNECLYNYRLHETSMMATQKDLIPQYNFLFMSFKDFSQTKQNFDVFEIFHYKIGSGCYNNLIPRLVNGIKSLNPSYCSFVRLFSEQLRRFNPEIYLFRPSELRGLQGVKKILLMKGKLTQFAGIVALKHFRPINKLVCIFENPALF